VKWPPLWRRCWDQRGGQQAALLSSRMPRTLGAAPGVEKLPKEGFRGGACRPLEAGWGHYLVKV